MRSLVILLLPIATTLAFDRYRRQAFAYIPGIRVARPTAPPLAPRDAHHQPQHSPDLRLAIHEPYYPNMENHFAVHETFPHRLGFRPLGRPNKHQQERGEDRLAIHEPLGPEGHIVARDTIRRDSLRPEVQEPPRRGNRMVVKESVRSEDQKRNLHQRQPPMRPRRAPTVNNPQHQEQFAQQHAIFIPDGQMPPGFDPSLPIAGSFFSSSDSSNPRGVFLPTRMLTRPQAPPSPVFRRSNPLMSRNPVMMSSGGTAFFSGSGPEALVPLRQPVQASLTSSEIITPRSVESTTSIDLTVTNSMMPLEREATVLSNVPTDMLPKEETEPEMLESNDVEKESSSKDQTTEISEAETMTVKAVKSDETTTTNDEIHSTTPFAPVETSHNAADTALPLTPLMSGLPPGMMSTGMLPPALERKELAPVDRTVDSDQDGLLSLEEVQYAAFVHHGLSGSVVQGMFQQVDEDGDGFLNSEEFNNIRPLVMAKAENAASKYIKNVDTDGNHMLSLKEAQTYLLKEYGISNRDVERIWLLVVPNTETEMDSAQFSKLRRRIRGMTIRLARQMMKSADSNGDGHISPEEAENIAFEQEGISSGDVHEMMASVDDNNDGELNAPEFADFERIVRAKAVETSRKALRVVDVDGSNTITMDEAKQIAFDHYGFDEAVLEPYFAQADENEDGQLDAVEFAGFRTVIRSRAVKNAMQSMKEMDTDGDGMISSDEAEVKASKDDDMEPMETATLFNVADQNKNGKLDKVELADFMRLVRLSAIKFATDHFREFDANRDGAVSFEELSPLIFDKYKVSEETTREFFDLVDVDRTGDLSPAEIVDFRHEIRRFVARRDGDSEETAKNDSDVFFTTTTSIGTRTAVTETSSTSQQTEISTDEEFDRKDELVGTTTETATTITTEKIAKMQSAQSQFSSITQPLLAETDKVVTNSDDNSEEDDVDTPPPMELRNSFTTSTAGTTISQEADSTTTAPATAASSTTRVRKVWRASTYRLNEDPLGEETVTLSTRSPTPTRAGRVRPMFTSSVAEQTSPTTTTAMTTQSFPDYEVIEINAEDIGKTNKELLEKHRKRLNLPSSAEIVYVDETDNNKAVQEGVEEIIEYVDA